MVFESACTDLGFPDADTDTDIYMLDLAGGTTSLVSSSVTGSGAVNGGSIRPVFAGSGSRVAYMTQASTLGPVDANGQFDLYLATVTA